MRRGEVTEGVLFVVHLEVGPEKNHKYPVCLQTRLSIQTGCKGITLQLSRDETISKNSSSIATFDQKK